MSEAVEQQAQGQPATDSLEPTKHRIVGKTSYYLMWLGGCVSIGTFTMGSSLVGTLNLLQASIAMAIGCLVIGIGLVVNGAAGYRYGIPFVVQMRSSFGFTGTKLPGLIRAIPALVWYGFQSWIGAAALNRVSITLVGFDSIIFYFILFQVIQTALAIFGFQGIKWLENIGSVFILGSLVYMFISVIVRYGAEISENLVKTEGTWGVPFWNATMLFLGIYATMMLNVSDYSREHTLGTSRPMLTTIYAMSILPVTMFMGLIGIMVSGATGVVNPIDVFANAVDNTPLLVVTLLFIAFAQITTNVLNNVVPPVYVLMDVFKMAYRPAVILVGVLAVGTFPWLLVRDESADGLQLFVQTYSAFLGPIFAVMVVDYYFIRRQRLVLDELYDRGGVFRGVNIAGIIATAVGVVVAFLLPSIGWYASLLPAGLTYYLLMTRWAQVRRFLPAESTSAPADDEVKA